MRKQLLTVVLAVLSILTMTAQTANMQDRALWASYATNQGGNAISEGDYKSHSGKVLVSWRMLPGDDENTTFDLYRKIGTQAETQLNRKMSFVGGLHYETIPITLTNYQDSPSDKSQDITYRLAYSGSKETLATYTIKAEQLKNGRPYISIPLKSTEDVSTLVDEFRYQANDCSVGDLDGDGQMEVVVKRLLTYYNADGSIKGTSEAAGDSDPRARHIAIFDAYKLDGTFMWRVMSGPNIIAGNSINFAVADLDGDGCAEVVTKTGEGTVFGDGYEIPDTDGDGKTDYRSVWPAGHYTGDGPKGYGGPEFFSVIDGKTGKELARADFICRGKEGETPAELAKNWYQNDWKWDPREKKYQWKLANSLRLGVAEFTGKGKQIFLGRGAYGRTVVEGWQYNGAGQAMTRLWKIDTDDAGGQDKNKDGKTYKAYAAQGNHAFNVADLDGDGYDEVMYGSCAWDHDGTGLWTSGLGHGDANHVGVFQKGYEGLQVYHCLENGKTMVALHDAKTGNIIWKKDDTADNDMGRCMVADVDPKSTGCEFWYYGNELFNQDGVALNTKETSANAGIWFDGTLSRQMINEGVINSFANGRTFTMYRYDISFNNDTKSNPGWYGDMLGDWREEVIVPDATKLKDIKIFSTWYPTEHRIPWLMTDHTYYMQCIHEQVGYNQPTNVGYYLGSDQTDAEIWTAAAKAEADRQAALHKYEVISTTVPAIGWSSVSLPYDAVVPEGTSVYYVNDYEDGQETGTLKLAKVETGGVIPARQGFLLNAAQGVYSFDKSATTDTWTGNKLVGTADGKLTGYDYSTATDPIYVLAEIDTETAGFLKFSGTTIDQYKAYLQLGAPVQARIFRLDTGGATAISPALATATSEDAHAQTVYSLSGTRLSQLRKGINVVRMADGTIRKLHVK